MQERAAKLAGSVAVISIGAATETEMKEKKARVESALHATRATVEGAWWPAAAAAVAPVRHGQTEAAGDEAIRRADYQPVPGSPLRQLVANAGLDASIVVAKSESQRVHPATTWPGQYLDLVKDGVNW